MSKKWGSLPTDILRKIVFLGVEDIRGLSSNPVGVFSTFAEGAFVRSKNLLGFLGKMAGKITRFCIAVIPKLGFYLELFASGNDRNYRDNFRVARAFNSCRGAYPQRQNEFKAFEPILRVRAFAAILP